MVKADLSILHTHGQNVEKVTKLSIDGNRNGQQKLTIYKDIARIILIRQAECAFTVTQKKLLNINPENYSKIIQLKEEKQNKCK